MTVPMVRVEHVSKKFAASLKRAMVYGIMDISRAALIPHRFRSRDFDTRMSDARLMPQSNEAGSASVELPQVSTPPLELTKREKDDLRPSEFWAVKDVNFEIRRGECLGIIGHNGAGKSTVFKLLSGIYGPTRGRIELNGTLSALIEVGSGFHPMLSGRENIYITGAIRGMKNEEINRKYQEIVDFSGVGEFIDMPVKFYSSGMHVRLGFAVLAHLTPDILLIDEILAVGDLAFQRKCIDHINRLRESDMALALVSHSLYRIESLCHWVLWMDRGEVVMSGPSNEIVKAYREHENSKTLIEAANEKKTTVDKDATPILIKNQCLTIHAVETRHADGRLGDKFHYGEDIILRIVYTAHDKVYTPRFNIDINFNNVVIFEIGMLIDGCSPDYIEGPGVVECRIKNPRLLPKVYEIALWGATGEGAVYIFELSVVGHFAVSAEGIEALPSSGPYAVGMLMTGGVVTVDYEWDISNARKADAVLTIPIMDA